MRPGQCSRGVEPGKNAQHDGHEGRRQHREHRRGDDEGHGAADVGECQAAQRQEHGKGEQRHQGLGAAADVARHQGCDDANERTCHHDVTHHFGVQRHLAPDLDQEQRQGAVAVEDDAQAKQGQPTDALGRPAALLQ